MLIADEHEVGYLLALVRDGIRYRTQALGRPQSKSDADLLAWMVAAHREASSSQLRSEVVGAPGASEVDDGEVIGVDEAARILGRPERTVISWAHRLGGWGGGRGRAWRFYRADVEAVAAEVGDGAA